MAILEKGGTATYEIPTIKNGIYVGRYVGEPEQFTSPFPNEGGGFDEKLRHTWAVDGPDGTVELSSFTSLKVGHEKATMTRYFVAARGQEFVDGVNADEDAQFDTDDLVGYDVSITVKNKVNKDGVKVPRVVDVDAAE